jgi:hypothetical protein
MHKINHILIKTYYRIHIMLQIRINKFRLINKNKYKNKGLKLKWFKLLQLLFKILKIQINLNKAQQKVLIYLIVFKQNKLRFKIQLILLVIKVLLI